MKSMDMNKVLRAELLALLKGGNAHMGFDEATAGFPLNEINLKIPNGSYTVWHLLEHMRIVQWDILRFVVDPDHVSPDFPDGYWPRVDETAKATDWKKTLKGFLADLGAVTKLVGDPAIDLFIPIPHAKDYTVFREILLVADHNAFHIGELVSLRRLMNLNPVKEY